MFTPPEGRPASARRSAAQLNCSRNRSYRTTVADMVFTVTPRSPTVALTAPLRLGTEVLWHRAEVPESFLSVRG
ncbi:hypothetical protein CS0771_53670 [Catellatospora sp. IY07-71]|nr:hypothetical protein CS0771_53670 [Catellatospora sp. IY07-71]